MERLVSNEQLLSPDLFNLQNSIHAGAEAVRFEVRFPAYHLNHGYIKVAEDAIAKILSFKQKFEQIFCVERVVVGIEENKDICFNCTFRRTTQDFNLVEKMEGLIDFCEENAHDIFKSYEVYDFSVQIYIRFMT